MYTVFDKATLNQIRNNEMREFENRMKQLGVDFKFGNIRFDAGLFTVKGEGKIINKPVETVVRDTAKHDFNLSILGCKLRMHQSFSHNGNQFQITGTNMRKTKNSIQLQRLADGKFYYTSADFVNRYAI